MFQSEGGLGFSPEVNSHPIDAGFDNNNHGEQNPDEEEAKDMSMRFLLNTDKQSQKLP